MPTFRIPVADHYSEIYQQFISLFNKNFFSIYSIPEAVLGPKDTMKTKTGKIHAPQKKQIF